MNKQLAELRERMDKIDEEIIALLRKRKDLVLEAIDLKKKNSLEFKDKSREAALFNHVKELARKHDLDEKYVSELFERILQHSHELV